MIELDEDFQSKRIRNIIEICPFSKEIFEIGCDHGYITSGLLLSEKTRNVIATDISMSAINKAILNCQKKRLLPFISFRQGDGFKAYTKYDRATTAVITGLGGMEILKMLEEKPATITDLVLQPMTDDYAIRDWLINHNFKIVKDYIFESDGYYYVVIYAKQLKKSEKFSIEPINMYFGRDNFDMVSIGENDFVDYLKKEEEKIISLFRKIGEISNALNFKYQLITEALQRCGIELMPVYEEEQNEENNEEINNENNEVEQINEENSQND